METLNSWATFIGWGVIVVVALKLINDAIERNDSVKRDKFGSDYSALLLAGRITLRDIFHNNDDPSVREEIRQFAMDATSGIGGLAILELNLSDADYQAELMRRGDGALYEAAIQRIRTSGAPLVLKGEKIRWVQGV